MRPFGRANGVRGDDIDTDRIIPARFLKTITFDGLEQHVFEDDRQQLSNQGSTHPFDRPEHQGARLLFVLSFGPSLARLVSRWVRQ